MATRPRVSLHGLCFPHILQSRIHTNKDREQKTHKLPMFNHNPYGVLNVCISRGGALLGEGALVAYGFSFPNWEKEYAERRRLLLLPLTRRLLLFFFSFFSCCLMLTVAEAFGEDGRLVVIVVNVSRQPELILITTSVSLHLS